MFFPLSVHDESQLLENGGVSRFITAVLKSFHFAQLNHQILIEDLTVSVSSCASGEELERLFPAVISGEIYLPEHSLALRSRSVDGRIPAVISLNIGVSPRPSFDDVLTECSVLNACGCDGK